ncbi:hypothetical protein D0T49_09090 [Paludibacter sp. 221]|uniref:translocation/assembly module TamB domain-containing protein n=1 Tax=Paludibacter sp. 221 TaxID=2302939 RepID=UPI0013D3126A|nr:translocation/assembly module TamB domain-containing protein [Paludibacter sp. 221]NDV47198.1 hypothetical protein [Paludibacter sp. 221]
MAKQQENKAKPATTFGKTLKVILKVVAWFLVGVIALIIIVLIAIQTPFVKSKIVNIAENQVNKILNAELKVGQLKGNFFTNLSLDDVVLTSEGKSDTIAYISAIGLRYRLLPLLSGKIIVEDITIEEPFVFVEQMPDSTWNLQHITKPSEEETDTTSASFNMLMQVNRFALNNGKVQIHAFSRQIPEAVDSLFIALSGHYSTNSQEARLSDFRFKTKNPDIELKQFNAQARGDKDAIRLIQLILQTVQNEISAQGIYAFDENSKSQVEISTRPIHLEEFQFFLPNDFHLQAKPTLNLDAELEDRKLIMTLLLKDEAQEIDLNLRSHRLIEYFSDSTTTVDYNMALNLKQIDLRYWLGDPEMNYLIDGKLNAEGAGLDPQTLHATVDGDFGNIVLYNNPVERLNFNLDYRAGDLDGLIDGKGSFGTVHLVPQLEQIMGNNPRYRIGMNTRNLNLAVLTGDKTYETNLNLDAYVNGSGLEPDKISARSQIDLLPSQAMGVNIDTLSSRIDFINRNIIINSLLLETLTAQLRAEGNYNLKGNSELNLEAYVSSADEIAAFAGLDSIETSLALRGNVQGIPDNLDARLNLDLGKSRYKDFTLDTLYAQANANVKGMGKQIWAEADVNANKFSTGGFGIDSIHLQAATNTKDVNLKLRANNSDIRTELTGLVKLGEAIDVALSDLLINYKGYNWTQVSDTAHINIATDQYTVQDFHLTSSGRDSIQSIFADGVIRRAGEQDFKLEITNVNIAELVQLFAPEQNATGLINLHVKLDGAAQNPELVAQLHVDSTSFQNYRFDVFKGDVELRDSKLNLLVNIVPQDSGMLSVNGCMPAQVRLDSMQFDFVPKENDSLHLNLLIEKLPLAIVNMFMPMDEVDGLIESDIKMDGTLKEPDIDGNININNGKLKLNRYGIDYRLIETDINFASEAISVDTFLIRSHDGTMTAKGNVQFASELYNADLSSSELSVEFDRFNPFDHRQFNMELSGNVGLQATADSVLFSGDLTIPEAYIYLPAILNLMGQSGASEIPKPLLVVEMEKATNQTDSIVYTVRPDTTATAQIPKFDFMNNLQGDIRVRIPRNTWIRNDDMRLELSGDVELVKHRDFFELFGTIDVVRGQYNMLGKVFVIQSGTVSFQGGEKINPILNIEAVYSFRDPERNKRDLGIVATGDIENLDIKFNLEGQSISEGDAVSYILFGMSMDALTSGQQSSLNSSMDAAGLAGMAAASLISSQLTKFLGNTLNVDYIEFNANSSFNNASITVGKYITNKLFVSYEQQIGVIEDKDVARYEMTLEYELFKFLFLQLTSSPITNGFDVIFKINSK